MVKTLFHAPVALSFAWVFVVCGCSSIVQDASPFPEQEARCDLRPAKAQCTDIRKFRGPSLVTFQGVCTTLAAAHENAAGYQTDATCPTETMLGGCQTTNGDGSLQTNWFYESDAYKTEADARAQCDSKMTWVPPQ